MFDARAADGEVAVVVVGGGDAGKALHAAQGVGEHAREIFQIGGFEGVAFGSGRLDGVEGAGGNGDMLAALEHALAELDFQLHVGAGRDFDGFFQQPVVDGADEQFDCAGGDAGEFEAAVIAGGGLEMLAANGDQGLAERLAGFGVHDGAVDGDGVGGEGAD